MRAITNMVKLCIIPNHPEADLDVQLAGGWQWHAKDGKKRKVQKKSSSSSRL